MIGNRVAGLEKVRGEMEGKEGREETHLFAPPASGLTTTQSSTLKFSLIQRNVLGSAYRLSTGTLKNPWI
jgi:hypothetical protein